MLSGLFAQLQRSIVFGIVFLFLQALTLFIGIYEGLKELRAYRRLYNSYTKLIEEMENKEHNHAN